MLKIPCLFDSLMLYYLVIILVRLSANQYSLKFFAFFFFFQRSVGERQKAFLVLGRLNHLKGTINGGGVVRHFFC